MSSITKDLKNTHTHSDVASKIYGEFEQLSMIDTMFTLHTNEGNKIDIMKKLEELRIKKF